MVLQGQLCGRVGRYRGLFEQPASNEAGCSLLYSRVFRNDPPPACAGAPTQNGPDRRSRRRGPHSPVRHSRDPDGGNAPASVWRARCVGQEAEGASGVAPRRGRWCPPGPCSNRARAGDPGAWVERPWFGVHRDRSGALRNCARPRGSPTWRLGTCRLRERGQHLPSSLTFTAGRWARRSDGDRRDAPEPDDRMGIVEPDDRMSLTIGWGSS